MGAVWMWLRAEARTRWRSWLALAIVAGIAGGAVIAAVAGARRTETAQERLSSWSETFDVIVQPYGDDRDRALREIGEPPQVAEWTMVASLPAELVTSSGRTIHDGDFYAFADPSGKVFRRFHRPKIVSGRMSVATRAAEVTVSAPIAERFGIRLGDRLSMRIMQADENGEATDVLLKTVRLRVVGIVVLPGDFRTLAGDLAGIQLTPAAARLAAPYIPPDNPSPIVRFRRGPADLAAYTADLAKRGLVYGSNIDMFALRDQTAALARADGFQANGLRILAILGGLAALVIVGQALARHISTESSALHPLRALGMAPRQLVLGFLVRAAGAGIVAMLVAIGVAVALSPLTPIGLAKDAEPHPGISVDVRVIALGASLIAVAMVLIAVLPSITATRSARLGAHQTGGRPSRLAERVGRSAGPAPIVVGARMTFESGASQAAATTRSLVVGIVLGLAVMIGALGFHSSIGHLLSSPRLVGWNWDSAYTVTGSDVGELPVPELEAAAGRVSADADVATFTRGAITDASFLDRDGGRMVELIFGIEAGSGRTWPTIIEGREPARPDEIALASETMRDAGVKIGESLPVYDTDGANPLRMRVVARMTMPHLFFSTVGPGRGAAMTMSGIQHFYPERNADTFLVGFKDGVDKAASSRRLVATLGPRFETVAAPRPASDLDDIGRLVDAPASLIAFLTVGLAAILGLAVVAAARRRRRELAVLKTLGFTRRQVFGVIASHATTVVVIGFVVALPFGVALGRWAWRFFASRISVVPETATSVGALAMMALGALIVTLLVAMLPARRAGRTPAALVLRTE